MEAHHQQQQPNVAATMHQQHNPMEQRSPDVSIKRAGGGSNAPKSKKRKRNQDLGPGAPRQPVNGKQRTWFDQPIFYL